MGAERTSTRGRWRRSAPAVATTATRGCVKPARGKEVYRAAYSLDQFLPLVNLHVDEKWEPYPDDPWTQAYSVLHAVVGWLVVPLLIAALAGIIKR